MRLLPVLDVAAAVEGKEVLGLTIGWRGEAIVLAATPADAAIALGRDGEAEGPSFPRTSAERPYDLSMLVVDGDDVSSRDLAGLTTTFPFVQPLPNGETLVVGGRVQWSAHAQASN